MKYIKYFIEFLFIISLFAIFKIIGLKNASALGEKIGIAIGPLFRSKTIISKNINFAFPNINSSDEKKIIKGMWSNYGRTFAEYVFLNKFSKNSPEQLVSIQGKDILDKIKEKNESVVFVSGHFANFELMAMQLSNHGINLSAIYRPLNNIFLNPLMEYLRIKYICPSQIKKGRAGMREILKKIQEKHSIALMIDQRVTEGEKVLFFNQPAYTTTIPAQIALKFRSKIVPISLKRISDVKFNMVVEKPIDVERSENQNKDILDISIKLNSVMENMIKNNPDQWIWSHNRWK
jgi:KDO2-lipid IV(A) lauroyltransferase